MCKILLGPILHKICIEGTFAVGVPQASRPRHHPTSEGEICRLVGRRSLPAYVSWGARHRAASGARAQTSLSFSHHSRAPAAMSAIRPKLAVRRLGLAVILAVAPTFVQTAKTTDDYLQPYKFVKPLKDLEELYSKHAPAAESRSDTVKNEEEPSKLEKKILMTDELEVPDLVTGDEALPRAQPLRDLKGRTRKRTSTSESKARLDNHKTDEEEDEEVEPEEDLEAEEMEVLPDVVAERSGQAAKETGPKAEPLKGKPYYSDDEYYYYYYDDEYYEDDEPYEQDIAARRKEESRYPNFPPSKSRQPTKTKPRPSPRPTRPSTRPTTRRTTRKPTPRYSKPKSNPYSSHKHKKSQSSSRSPEYNIASTIERLKAIKRQQELKRNGVPSLPNPWDRLNKYSSHKTKKDHR